MTRANTSTEEVLRRVPIFGDLTEIEISFLSQKAVPRRFAAGELLFAEGDSCEGLFVIERGNVRLFKTSPSGREQVLAIDGPGSSVAELPVFDGGNYPASASAVNDVAALFISRQDFHSMCLVHPQVALKVLRVVGKRLRALVGIIEELSFTTVRSRLISLLLKIARQDGQTSGSATITLPASNQEVAAQVGTVRELVSRNLSRLQAEDLIRIEGREITIPDLRRLRDQLENVE